MAITVRWDDVMDSVLFVTFRGSWTWNEYQVAAADIQSMIDSAPGRVDSLVDTLSNVVVLPPDFGRLAGEAADQVDPRLKLTVIVGNDINREILHALTMNYPFIQQRYRFAPSIEQGRALIAASRAESDLPAGGKLNGGWR